MVRPFFFLVAAFTLALSACASGSGGARSSASVITEEELRPMAAFSVYESIQRLRPRWLQGRASGADVAVFMDGQPVIGGTDFLWDLQAVEVLEIRFRSASDATTRYGTGYPAGVIELRRRN